MDKFKKRIIWILIVILTIILLAAVFYRAHVMFKENKAEQEYEGVRNIIRASSENLEVSE